MLRLLYILLFVLCCSVTDASSSPLASQCVECEYVAAGDDNIALPIPLDDHSYDAAQGVMLMPRTASRYVVETGNGGAVSPTVRYNRSNGSSKTLSAAIPSRHIGRLTKIFEYNHFRSMLRVAYYLHTLCRLRI